MASKNVSSADVRQEQNAEGVTMHTIADLRPPNIAQSVHQLLKGDEVAIRAIPRNIERTTVKRGFHFNILVAGRYDLGQEELIETLFGVTLNKQSPDQLEDFPLKEDNTAISDGPVKLHLKVLTTPNFGTRIDDSGSYKPIIRNIQNRMMKHLHNESQLFRKKDTPDERIHVCLYLFAPSGPLIMPNDEMLLKRLVQYCNVIPVIARADMLTVQENAKRKAQIREALDEFAIFQLPIGDSQYDEAEWIEHLHKIAQRQPFACLNTSSRHMDPNDPLRINPNNETYSDTTILRAAIVAHMCELVDSTHFVHYEDFRAKTLTERHGQQGAPGDGNSFAALGDASVNDEVEMVDRQLHHIRTAAPAYYAQPGV